MMDSLAGFDHISERATKVGYRRLFAADFAAGKHSTCAYERRSGNGFVYSKNACLS